MNENIKVAQNENEAKEKRFYTHVIVSYATEEEIIPLLNQAKHWAYIVHDKDEGKDKHVHILATFEKAKSFAWVRKQVVSEQNTFTEFIKGDVEDVIGYFQHKETNKHPYDYNDIVFDDEDYWIGRMRTGEREEDKNEAFVDDLLADDYSVERMSRKYGRDFIKNFHKYTEARNYMLWERGEVEKLRKARKEQEELKEAIELLNSLNWQK